MVRFGVIGTGKITEEFVMSARASGCADVTAVYSRKTETGNSYAEKQKIENVFADIETMLKSKTIDAVYIASPNAFHAAQAILCLQHKIPVLVEKPASSNADEFQRVINQAKESSTLLMEAVKSTLVPAFTAFREQLHKLGKIHHYFSSFCQYSSRYDAYLAGEYRNAFDLALSNGSLMDIGIYGVYPAVLMFGVPRSIQASSRLLRTGVDGGGSLILQYDEMDAVILHSKSSDSWLPTEIQGEKATLRLDKIVLPQKVEILYRNGTVEEIIAPKPDPFMCYEIREFVQLMESSEIQSKVNSWNVSLETLRVLDEARRQTGVTFPADAQIDN